MKIYFSSAKKSGNPLNLMAGDTDYIETLLSNLKNKLGQDEVIHIEEDMRRQAITANHSPITGDQIINELLTKREPGIFHLMLNLPFTQACRYLVKIFGLLSKNPLAYATTILSRDRPASACHCKK